MSLKFSLQNKKLTGMDHELSDYLWHEFHCGNLDSQDDFYTLFHEWIDNQVIYTYDCEQILESNSEYHYNEHDVFGRPENIAQAAYSCLYDYLLDSPDTVTYDEMEETKRNSMSDREIMNAKRGITPVKSYQKTNNMLVQYLIELIDKWEADGIQENEMVARLLNRWPNLEEKNIRGIINYRSRWQFGIHDLADQIAPVIAEQIQETIAWQTDGYKFCEHLDGDDYLQFANELKTEILKQLKNDN